MLTLNDWKESSIEDIYEDFAVTKEDVEGVEILLASYLYEDYEGDSIVLFKKDNQLYAVHGSHCSCFGLEGQWDPEETSLEALLKIDWSNYGLTPEIIKTILE